MHIKIQTIIVSYINKKQIMLTNGLINRQNQLSIEVKPKIMHESLVLKNRACIVIWKK